MRSETESANSYSDFKEVYFELIMTIGGTQEHLTID